MQTIGPKVNLGTTRDDLNLSRVHTGRENERIVAFLCVLPVRVGGGRGGGEVPVCTAYNRSSASRLRGEGRRVRSRLAAFELEQTLNHKGMEHVTYKEREREREREGQAAAYRRSFREKCVRATCILKRAQRECPSLSLSLSLSWLKSVTKVRSNDRNLAKINLASSRN